MTTQATPQAAGATLHLGGDAYCTPDLAPLLVPIDQLHPFPGNARRGDQDAITASIRDLGVWRAHVVQTSTGHVIVGNHQLRGLLDLGAAQAPASYRECDDDYARAMAIRDNHTSDLGGYDQGDLLALYRATDQTVGLELAGLTSADMADLERALGGAPVTLTDPDEAPLLLESASISHLGDIWRLGPHLLVVGDARETSAYDMLLGTTQAACIWTDPPYGVEYVGKTKRALTIQNDGAADLALLLATALGEAIRAARPGGAVYVAAPPGPQGFTFWRVLLDLGAFRQTLIWVKDVFVLGHSDYHYKHEPIYYGYVPGAEGRRGRGGEGWYGDHSQTSILDYARPKRSKEHPTMKPVELVAYCLRNSTSPGDLVLDPFAGSGTTLIACHQEDRTARLIELDPAYADVICRRYQQHTGTLPVRDGIQVDFLGATDA